ncbi:MAG: thermostable hemolysin [Parcubacteria group bacterium]|nr:thermostable hemolysin [Parcubacteria group bacterium]
MKKIPIVIKIANSNYEREKAIKFIDRLALKYYQCHAPPLSQIILTAYSKKQIVGSLGINFAKNNKLPIEKHWIFDHNKTPLPYRASKLAEYGRWFATQPNISFALYFSAASYVLQNGKKYAFFEVKDSIARHIKHAGVKLFLINAQLLIENIEKKRRNYYLIPPTPKFYMTDNEQTVETLRKIAIPQIQSGEIIIEI